MASSGYQPSDDETTNIGDTLSGTAEQSQNQRSDAGASRLAAARHAAGERCRQLEKSANECVQKYPDSSMAVVAAASVALGLLIGKNWSRHH